MHFARVAVQYYIAGRSAAINQLLPVAGNLLHHAVEMSLKAALAASHSMGELRAFNHNLPNAWRTFVAAYHVTARPQFEAVVNALHRFENLRYPDSLLTDGAEMQLALHRTDVITSGPTGFRVPRVPIYLLVLEEVDELQEAIFAASNLNPKFFSGSLSAKAREHLLERNLHSNIW